MALALLRPFDAVSTALYAAAFRAGRRLGRQIIERCAEPPRPAKGVSEVEAPTPVSVLPGATVEGTALGWIEPTPENSHIVDLRATGDDAFHEAMLVDAMAAIDSGKAVVFGDIAADKDIFSIGRIDDRYLIFVGDHPPATYADLKAAMRHGLSAIEGEY